MLTLEKPMPVHNIRVVFKCEESDTSKLITTLFSVEAYMWGKAESGKLTLPLVNYPPSMYDTYVGHQIDYTLQGFLELQAGTASCTKTAPVPVMYLPLVTCMPLDDNKLPAEPPKKSEVFKGANATVQTTAQLIKPAYCPGDVCTVKMTTNNQSDGKITCVQISFVSIATTLAHPSTDVSSTSTAPILSAQTLKHQRHTLHSETFYVSIKKHAKDESIFQFRIPPNCVPTTQNYVGKYLDISYEVIVSIPLAGVGSPESTPSTSSVWSSLLFTSAPSPVNTISLPVIIATVPPSYPIPPELQFTQSFNGVEPEKPSFIPNIESPLPSPSSPFLGEGSSWGPGSPADSERLSMSPSNSFRLEDSDMGEVDATKMDFSLQDATGHLMVPSLAENPNRESRRRSVSSNASDCAVEINAPSDTGVNKQAAVQ
ncbi:hypothetical protein DFQ28_010055 [Apophysomyces sp. BC1034]|nr:hypothetical protein DFQ28_010055 [Apophysomyces sp. BC1034]